MVNDTLSIVDPYACDPELVTYYLQTVIPGLICKGAVDTINIKINPGPQIIQDEVFVVCQQSSAELDISDYIAGCSENTGSYSFTWTGSDGTGGSGQIIVVSDDLEPGI